MTLKAEIAKKTKNTLDKTIKNLLLLAMFLKTNWHFIMCYFLLLPSILLGKSDPSLIFDVPISNFSLPLFDENGVKTWEVHGATATMLSKDSIVVTDTHLSCFSMNCNIPTFSATSKSAVIQPSTSQILGGDKIAIVGQNFSAYADNWELHGDAKKIIAKNNVKVLYNERPEKVVP